jgi:hypothetical protein
MVLSRGERSKQQEIYDRLHAEHIPRITNFYRKMHTSRPLIEKEIAKAKRQKWVERTIAVLGLALGGAALLHQMMATP